MKYFIFTFLFLFGFIVNTVQADQNKVEADLVSPYEQIVTGEEVMIGLYTQIDDKWHTYWKNPGDSGLETNLTFDAVEGVTIGEMRFPTPKVIPYQGLVNYGYEGNVLYELPLTLSSDFKGDKVTITGRADWLVCEEICIPETSPISLTLNVGDELVKGVNNVLFEQAEKTYPKAFRGEASVFVENGDIVFNFAGFSNVKKAYFFPDEWGVLEYNAPQKISVEKGVLTLKTKSAGDLKDFVTGVLKVDNEAFVIKAEQVLASQANLSTQEETPISLIKVLIYAFLGGMILNLMPCVFPVLSIKAMSLVGHADEDQALIRKNALLYLAGVVVTFLIIGGALLLLQSLGHEIGWGFQLQSPIFVALMAILFFAVAMNLAGLFEIGTSLMNVGSSGQKGAFGTGVLAVIVASPCSAPFMATALGATLWLSGATSLLVFLSLGLGLAFPYVLISYSPTLIRYLPRPGAWMETFKQALSFPMFASMIWLLYVVMGQVGPEAVLATLAASILVVFILWINNKKSILKLPLIIIALVSVFYIFKGFILIDEKRSEKHYIAYDPVQLETLLEKKQPVFVNMTADWCITCLANERTSLSDEKVKKAFKDKNITYMKGDWTLKDKKITQYLKSYDRNGVPLYVYYDENGDVTVLPQILTTTIVLDAIK